MSRDEGAEEKGFEQFEQFLREWSRRDFLRRTGGAAAYLAFMAGGAELLAACGPSNTTNSLNPVKGGKLIEGSISDISTFNTLNSGDTASTQMITLCFDGLLGINAAGDNIPMLAQALPTVSPDSLTITFKLRPNLKWSDGSPLTADDVVFSYNLMFLPETKDFVSRYRSDLEGFLQSVTAPDPQTVVFKFSNVLANFIDSHCRRQRRSTPMTSSPGRLWRAGSSSSSSGTKVSRSCSPATTTTGPASPTSTSTSSRS
jgi:hypothetical protein